MKYIIKEWNLIKNVQGTFDSNYPYKENMNFNI